MASSGREHQTPRFLRSDSVRPRHSLGSRIKSCSRLSEGELPDVNINVPLGRLHCVSGTVVEHGMPVPSIKVTIHSQQDEWNPNEWHSDAETSPDGSFRFDLVPPGTYILEAEQEKFFGPYGLSMEQFSVRGACGFVLVAYSSLCRFFAPPLRLWYRRERQPGVGDEWVVIGSERTR